MIPFLMKRSKAVLFIAAILLLFGTYSAVNLPVKVFPSLTFPYIQVTASVETDRNISELEREVAFPIEDAVVGRGIVKEVSTTTTSKNVSVLVTLKDSATKDETEALVDELNQKLNNVSIELDEKQVLQFNSSDQQFMQIAIAPDSIENASVREELLDRVVPQLRQVSGVSAVDHSLDAYEMKYEFVIKPEKIENLEVSSQLVRHIRSLFDAQAMGVVEYAGNQVLVRTDREIVSETELAGYRLPNGDKLTDIVDVRLVRDADEVFNRMDGKPVYFLMIKAPSDESQVDVSQRVREKMDELYQTKSTDWSFSYVTDTSLFIGQVIKELVISILIGAVVACLVLLYVFRSFRTTLVIGLSIPISVFSTFVVMKLFGYSLNLATLVGVGIGTGMIVDACIVVLENIFKKQQQGLNKLEAVRAGTMEVITPNISSVLTTVAVFAPIGFLGGQIGQIIRQLAITVSSALLLSLLVSVSVTPILAYYLLQPKKSSSKQERTMRFYESVLRYVLDRKKRILAGLVALLVASFALFIMFVPKGYLPHLSSGAIFVNYEIDENTPFADAKGLLEKTASEIRKLDGVDHVYYWTRASQTHVGNFYVSLTEKAQKPKNSKRVETEIGKVIDSLVPYSSISLSQGDDNAGKVELSLSGNEMTDIVSQVPLIKEEIGLIPGVTGVTADLADEGSEWVVDFDEQKLRAYGLQKEAVQQYMGMVLNGIKGIDVRINDSDREASIVFPESFHYNSEMIRHLPLKQQQFTTVADVATIREVPSVSQRTRKDGNYELGLTVWMEPEDKTGVVRELTAWMNGYPAEDVALAFSGQQQQQQEGFQNLTLAIEAAMVVIFLILMLQFNRFFQPFLIVYTLPFAVIGITLGFLITGRTFDLMAMIGMLMLVGIAVNNAIMLIDFINRKREETESVREAVIEGAKQRLRPVLTTTMTTIGGLFPMFLGGTNTSDFQTPVATSVIFGLLFSTLIVLVIVPVGYEMLEGPDGILNRYRSIGNKIWRVLSRSLTVSRWRRKEENIRG